MPDADPEEFARVATDLGARVRRLRQHVGLTQEGLALRVGKDRKTIQNLEYGRASTPRADGTYGPGNPQLDLIFRLSVELGVDMAELVANPD